MLHTSNVSGYAHSRPGNILHLVKFDLLYGKIKRFYKLHVDNDLYTCASVHKSEVDAHPWRTYLKCVIRFLSTCETTWVAIQIYCSIKEFNLGQRVIKCECF